MKLPDYIRGLRKGKEAHRLEKESMKDPFLADAIDGYHQVEGDHEKEIEKLRKQILAHTVKKKKSQAITWSIAASLMIGIGISSYFLFLKKSMPEEFMESSSLVDSKVAGTNEANKDTLPEIVVKETVKKDIIAKSKVSSPPQNESIRVCEVREETTEQEMATEPQKAERQIVAKNYQLMEETEISSISVTQKRLAQATMPIKNIIKGKVTDEKGEPIAGASVTYSGTNIGTLTDEKGEFNLPKREGNELLRAQFIGFDPVELPIDTNRVMLIAMNEDKQSLNEVVVVGSGIKKQISLSENKTQKPQPTIGLRKYKKYLKDHLIRPKNDQGKNVEGVVLLSFIVDKEGNPRQIKIKKGLCETADKEAIRLIQEGPRWTPGSLPVEVTVHF